MFECDILVYLSMFHTCVVPLSVPSGTQRLWCSPSRAIAKNTTLPFILFSSRRRHTISDRDWSSDVCSSDLSAPTPRNDSPEITFTPKNTTANVSADRDRKSVGEGKRVDLGGRRIIKKKKTHEQHQELIEELIAEVAAYNKEVDRELITFFFSSRRRHTRSDRDWSSDVCSSDLHQGKPGGSRVDRSEQPGGLQ